MWNTIRQQWDFYALTFLLGMYLAGAVLLAAALLLMVPAALG
ncbi:MAG TPA: hypothetical protein VMO00_20845 [Methylomirabilota bacterium]|nr:hypothetical protein [Methylomirabilota bacterium]